MNFTLSIRQPIALIAGLFFWQASAVPLFAGEGGSLNPAGDQIIQLNNPSNWGPQGGTNFPGNFQREGRMDGGPGHPGGHGGHGNHHRPHLTAAQKQAFEACLQSHGITVPPPSANGGPPTPPDESQRQIFHQCHEQAAGPSTGGFASSNSPQHLAMKACMENLGVDTSTGSYSSTAQVNVGTALQTCRAQVYGGQQ